MKTTVEYHLHLVFKNTKYNTVNFTYSKISGIRWDALARNSFTISMA